MNQAVTIAPLNSSETAFDYDALDKATAKEARAAAERIRERNRASIIDTGRDLLSIKEKLDHGQFGAWLDAEFGMNRRSAQNYMSAAMQFGDKSETVSHLPARAVYQLAAPSTPEPVRSELMQRLEKGERVPADEIQFRIADAKGEAKLTDKERLRRERQRRRNKADREKFERERAARQKEEEVEKAAAVAAVALILECIGKRRPELAALIERAGFYLSNELRRALVRLRK